MLVALCGLVVLLLGGLGLLVWVAEQPVKRWPRTPYVDERDWTHRPEDEEEPKDAA